MIIHNQDIELSFPKILISNDIFPLVSKVINNNKGVMVISPWTKVNELLNFTKDNAFTNILKQEYAEIENHIFNIEYVNTTITSINKLLNHNLIDFDYKSNKLVKNHLAISDELLNNETILDLLVILDKYATSKTKIIILGFRNKVLEIMNYKFERLEILFIQPYLDQVASYQNLESILLDQGDHIFEVLDAGKLLSYLESKTKTVLTKDDLNNYFNGDLSLKSFLIHKVLWNLEK